MHPDTLRSILKENNIPFEEKAIQHGCQFRFKDGAILSAFETGKTAWQGKASKTKSRVTALMEPQADTVEAEVPAAPVREHLYSNRVFIVYGHDTQAREQLELLLRRLKLVGGSGGSVSQN